VGSNLSLENSYSDYRLVVPGFESHQGRRFFLVQHVHIGSGVNPPSCQIGIGGSSHGVSDRSVSSPTPCIAKFKNGWSYTSAPLYVFMASEF